MATKENPTSKDEVVRHAKGRLPTQAEDPAAMAAEERSRGQPAQVTVEDKRRAEQHPEDVPSPGNMGPPEGAAD
jgi:hypothetical protein